MKKWLLLIVGSMLLLSLPVAVSAAEFRSGNHQDGTVNIDKNQSPQNLYVGGSSITVDAKTKGDLVVAGGTIIIDNDVEDSLFAAGGTVTIRSNVGRHVRVAGGSISISGHVSGDLFVAGGTVSLTRDTVVDGGTYISGQTVTVDGTLNGEVKINGDTIVVNGKTGSLTTNGRAITVNNSAEIRGDFRHTGPNKPQIGSSTSVTGQTIYNAVKSNRLAELAGVLTVTFLLRLLGTMLLAWLLARLFPMTTAKMIVQSIARPLPSIGAGLLFFIFGPLVVLALGISLVGLPIAGVLFGLWLLIFVVGLTIGKLTVGVWLIKTLTREKEYKVDYQAIVAGILLVTLVGYVPFIGWLVSALVFLLGLGITAQTIWSIRDRQLVDTQPPLKPIAPTNNKTGQ